MFYFWYGSIILTGLRASIGVTRSYSSHPFLCALDVCKVVDFEVELMSIDFYYRAQNKENQSSLNGKVLSKSKHKHQVHSTR